jgi:hypothetical protein
MIELNGTLKAADFARLHYAHRLRRTWPLIVAIVVLTTILSLIVCLYPYPALSVVVRFLLVILVVGITLSALIPYRAARRQLKNELYFRDPIIERFKPMAMNWKGPNSLSKWRGRIYRKYMRCGRCSSCIEDLKLPTLFQSGSLRIKRKWMRGEGRSKSGWHLGRYRSRASSVAGYDECPSFGPSRLSLDLWRHTDATTRH